MPDAEHWFEEPMIGHAEIAAFAGDVVNISRDELKGYREQLNRVCDRVAEFIQEHPDYSLVKILRSGSVAKGTALSSLNDMDVAIYISSEGAPSAEPAILTWLTGKLRDAYKGKMEPDQFQPQDHTVCISFKESDLDVEVAPVIYEGGADDRGFLVSRDTGKRLMTSIPLHLQFVRARKEKQPRHFAQVIRLLKWWAAERKEEDAAFRCKSFMIELICAHLADNGMDCSDYLSAIEQFFRYIVRTRLRSRISFIDNYKVSALPGPTGAAIEIFDPVNPTNNVADGYTEGDRTKLVSSAQAAFNAVTYARYAMTKGESMELWQGLMGAAFGRAQ
jgi:hypothetical protein